jgi:hypothetical protein
MPTTNTLANTLCRAVLGVLSLEETSSLIMNLAAVAETDTVKQGHTKVILTLGLRAVRPGEKNDSGVVEVDTSSLFQEVQGVQ